MIDNDTKRLSRLTAMLTQLQTKRLVTATELANRFGVSVRTVYRDIRALEQAGVPIVTEEGRGYALMEGYRIPPIMFTENEALALIIVEQLVLKNSDLSLIDAYVDAVNKVRAVMKAATQSKAELLSQRLVVKPQLQHIRPSDSLIVIQKALTEFRVLSITYHSGSKDEVTQRLIEPFAIYHNLAESWMLIAYCRLRQDFRLFRIDRIQELRVTDQLFEPHPMTLAEYIEEQRKKYGTPDTGLS